ncbi:GNAT family N-acetyltransferase [Haloechinothrix salitolerans]|uniref:GNAT family N-acetyltransferase n=1 Tax=Haloechinothrix salitolerans TaxID=926830 RepID=A0ABW2C9B4_9PSEU
MEPIEINAGTYYLRQFRADDRLDDRPALLSAFSDPAVRGASPDYGVDTIETATAYIHARAAGWRDDSHYTWAIAELTTGRLIGEVRLELGDRSTTGAGSDGASPDTESEPVTARLTVWTHADTRRQGVAATAVSTVLRFGFGALDLERVEAICAKDNAAAVALAHRCGFRRDDSCDSGDGTPATLHWTTNG